MNMVVEHHAAEAAGYQPLKSPADASSKAKESVRKLSAMPKEYLSFKLGEEEYGIDILRVQEIRSYEPPTRIANAPGFIKGVVNLRGVIVPIVDLRLKLACTSVEYTECTVVIVLNVHNRVIGVVVDSVSDVLALNPDDIKEAPEMNSAVDAGFIMGMGCIKSGDVNRMLILTDISTLMGSEDMGLVDVMVN